jgi:hypothetical protein
VRPLVPLLLAASLAAGAAGCGGGGGTGTRTILDGDAKTVSLTRVRQGIDELYRDHPDIRHFVARDVRYTPVTRDKVMYVCSHGGPEPGPRERETSRLFGCAPLIFFFYRYGRESDVPQAVELARELYWYAASIRRPYEARPVLTALLESWGVE